MYAFIVWVVFLWFFVLFCDTIFKTCMFHPYFRVLRFSGLSIQPLIIYFRITRYNRLINRMGQWRSSFLKTWFNAGAIITSIISGPFLMLYLVSMYQIYKSATVEDLDNSVLLPIIPGYNFPLSHLIYYIIIVLLCSIIHEFGHALAASRERIGVEEFGFALCAVFPFAFVNLRFDQFRQLSRWQQMRILCAGIWHNIILAFLALFFWICLTILLSPLYSTGNGVTVYGIHQKSGLNHPAGFEINDQIYNIGNCNIDLSEDWSMCLKEISRQPQQGLCVPETITDSVSLDECFNSSVYLKFQTLDEIEVRKICLHARQATEYFSACNETSACFISSSCMFPTLPSKMDRFVTIKRHQKPSILYVGIMDELFANVQVSHFNQKYKLFPVSYAEAVARFLEYVITLSGGLGCLNILPILSLDGQFIIETLIHMCFEKFIPRFEQRSNIFIWINRIALNLTILFVVLIAYKLYMFIY